MVSRSVVRAAGKSVQVTTDRCLHHLHSRVSLRQEGSSNKKLANGPANTGASSPVLPPSRKRKSSLDPLQDEPLAKKMADNQILESITGIKTSMVSMEQQLKAAPTKADFWALVNEIKGVKENVIRNKDRIDTLYDLCKQDGEFLVKRMEKMVEGKIANTATNQSSLSDDNERSFLRSRRSVRLWPVQEGVSLDKGVKRFLTFCLKMPVDVVDSLSIQQITKQGQARRSKILTKYSWSSKLPNRDTVQSNLATAQGQAGLQLDIPDYLRGLFRLFETHAAALQAKYGVVKRAIRFDDVDRSLYMDVKLENIAWHRITADEMRSIETRKRATNGGPDPNTQSQSA